MKWMMRIFAPAHETTFYSVNRDGALVLDLRGLLATGRMNKQFQAARALARLAKKEAA